MTEHVELTEAERDSLTECECGHFANEHSSEGCLATDFSEDWRPIAGDDKCSCSHFPTVISRHAIEAIVAARVQHAREERDQAWARDTESLLDDLNRWAETFTPDSFSMGQSHLAPAFRKPDYRAAQNALMKRVNELEASIRALVARMGGESDG